MLTNQIEKDEETGIIHIKRPDIELMEKMFRCIASGGFKSINVSIIGDHYTLTFINDTFTNYYLSYLKAVKL